MEELRQSNQELLKSLKIGQQRAWDILRDIKVDDNKPGNNRLSNNRLSKTLPNSTPPPLKAAPYTFSTPTNAYLDLLDKAGNRHYEKLRVTPKSRDAGTRSRDISFSTISADSTVGRPHKTPQKQLLTTTRDNNTCLDEPHSPYCTENHREKLHRKLNASYSKLAADLRQIAPYCGADVIYDMADNSAVSVTHKPESYYEDMKRFRMANSDQCSVKLPDYVMDGGHEQTHQHTDKENTELAEREHQCIQTYTVGPGYRPAPDHSCKQCPLCIGADDTKHRGLIRVNIAQSDMVNYSVSRPKARDNLDSVSLSAHCSSGWEHAASARTNKPSTPSDVYYRPF